jgi:SAM-dependent methyltransferase
MMARVDPPIVSYAHASEFPGWSKAEPFLIDIVRNHKPRRILEIGSGANPTLPLGHIPDGTAYITCDIDADELAKAGPGYATCRLDLERGDIPADLYGQCDLVFSRMVNEHIQNGREYHKNIFDILAPGGMAVHCFATLYTLPFVINRIMPSGLSSVILNYVSPRDEHRHGKFRAYYRWSRGPTKRMIRRFQALGYEVVSYNGYFGHWYYRRRMGLLDQLEQAKARTLLSWPVPLLCSFATVFLRKPIDVNAPALTSTSANTPSL